MIVRPDGRPGRRARALAAAALALLLWPAGAAAAPGGDAPESDIEAVPLESLVDLSLGAASLHQERVSETAAAAFVLTGDDLRAQGFRTLGEALGAVPGLYGYRDDIYGMVGVRGLGTLNDYGTRLLVLLDGHPLNDSVGLAGTRTGRDLPVPLEAVKRVEIVKGPVGSLYGPTAFLGLVNVVTVDADDRASLARLGGETGAARALGGEGSAVAAGRLGPARVTVAVQGFASRGADVRLPELTLARPDRPGAADPTVRGAGGSGAASALLRVAWAGFTLQGACGGWGGGLVAAGYGAVIGSDQNRATTRTCFADLSTTRPLGAALTLDARAAWDWTGYRDAYLYPPPPEGYGLFRDTADDRWGSGELRLTWRPGPGTLAIAGATGQLHRTLQRAYVDGLPSVREDPVDGVGAGDLPADYATVNAYLLLDQRLGATLRAHLGATWYWHQTFGQRITPKAALVWSPTARDVVKLIYSQGFRAPTAVEAFYDDAYSYLANPRLRAEVVDAGEVIWSRQLGPDAALTASGFASRYVRLVQFRTVPAPGVADPDPADPLDWRLQAQNAASLWQRGGELTLTGRFGRWLSGWAGLSAQTVTAAAHANSPALIGQLALTSRALWEPLALSVHASALTRRALDPDNLPAGGQTHLPASLQVGAAALLDLPGLRGLSVELGVTNLTGAAAPDPLPADYTPVTRLPQAPRTFRLALRWHPD